MASTPTPQTAPQSLADRREIRIVSHSTLFYWWPIWVIGFFMALWTLVEDHRMAILPKGSDVTVLRSTEKDIEYILKVPGKVQTVEGKEVQPTRSLTHAVVESAKKNAQQPYEEPFKPRVSQASWMGPVFCIFLILVVFITNVPLRGLWSVITLISIALITVVLAFFDLWDDIFRNLSYLHIYINLAGYLTIATLLFIIWLVVVVFFDQQIYMVFTPGQLRVRTEIGGGETSYDTMGLVTEKHRDDLFRHWVLGLGSGDLTVKTAGAAGHTFTMPNVLFVGWKLRQIQEMMRDKPIVQG